MDKTVAKLHEYTENLNDLIYATVMQLKEMDPENSDEDRLINWYSQGTVAAYKDIQAQVETEIGHLVANAEKGNPGVGEHLLKIAHYFNEKRDALLKAQKDAGTEKDRRFARGQADCYHDMLIAYLKTFADELEIDEANEPDWLKPYRPYFAR